ncbi:MAG: glycosyltransferase [Halioglobus sp.]
MAALNLNGATLSAQSTLAAQTDVAVLIPCLNESETISKVVEDFREALPHARIYVYDNNSTDDTLYIAQRAGAIVGSERYQGKGHVVRRMFADIDAGAYVLVDGDDTYHAPSVTDMLNLLLNQQLDMVVAARQHSQASAVQPTVRSGPIRSGPESGPGGI